MAKALGLKAAAGAVAALVLLAGGAQAQVGLSISPTGSDVRLTTAETGQSLPTGMGGWVGGTLNATGTGLYSFTYGPNILAGSTGRGDSSFINEFWVGASQSAAETAGTFFCTQTCGSYGATAVGSTFSLVLNPGAINFGFTFDQAGASPTLTNGQTNNQVGAYLVTTATSFASLSGTPSAGPNQFAYLGLADQTMPTLDSDFQDLTVQVQAVPEPMGMALLASGLACLAIVRRRSAARAA